MNGTILAIPDRTVQNVGTPAGTGAPVHMKTILAILGATLAMCANAQNPPAVEDGLRTTILRMVDEVNPIDPGTGARTYISFAFLSDIHKCRRVPGDDDAANPVTDYWYGSAGCLTESEPSIRLLGSLAEAAGLDAVINGGDLSTAPISNGRGLTEAEYTNEIWNVKAMFDRYVPASVPLFTIDGNHERSYTANGANMQLSDEAWGYVLANFNTPAEAARARGVDVTYHRDLPAARLGVGATGRFAGNSYHLDFGRLRATKGYNVRIACISSYDRAAGADPAYRAFDAAQFFDPSSGEPYEDGKTPENTILGMVSHEGLRGVAGTLQNGFLNGFSNPAARQDPWNLGTHPGLGFFGLVCGHQHYTNEKPIKDAFDMRANPGNDVFASMVQVASAYAVNKPSRPKEHQLGTEAAYHFSLFVVDTDRGLLREIRVGGWTPNPVTHESPVVQLHETRLRLRAAPPAPAAETAPVRLMLPREGATVPLLGDGQKAFFASSDAERLAKAGDPAWRADLLALGWEPKPVVFVWSGINSRKERLRFRIWREDDGACVCDRTFEYLTTGRFEWDNFRLGCRYRWTVDVAGKGSATGTFRTEDRPPRLIRVPGVPNMRDLGGWTAAGGRRVKQGLLYRSANLCENATECPGKPPRPRLDEAGVRFMTEALGIRTELDLRGPKDCAGLDGSPLGPTVRRAEISSGCYGQMDEPWAKEACRKSLELIADGANLPLLFHCSSGQDRTGTLAFLVNGLLGVAPEDLVRDWEASALWKDEHDWFNRNNTYAALLAVMDNYPGDTLNARIESYVKSTGFSDADLARLRALLLD